MVSLYLDAREYRVAFSTSHQVYWMNKEPRAADDSNISTARGANESRRTASTARARSIVIPLGRVNQACRRRFFSLDATDFIARVPSHQIDPRLCITCAIDLPCAAPFYSVGSSFHAHLKAINHSSRAAGLIS